MHISAIALAVILAMTMLSQTVFATTYTITDGDRVITYTTFSTDPTQVLDEAGMELSELDTYTTQAVDGRASITVQRAAEITVQYRGRTVKATTSNETVGELLSRLGMELTGEDTVSHALEERTYDGMDLRIDQVQTARKQYTTVLPHDTTYCDDPSLPEGVEQVLTPGADGQVLCTAQVTYTNGLETLREITEETVTRNPVTEIVAVGTGPDPMSEEALPVIGDGTITLPSGEVLSFTRVDHVRATAYTHTDAGCDLVTATGTTVHWGTVAVDPRYIPYGTKMFIVANDGSYVYGLATAEDCGGDIKGDRMDLYMPSFQQCMEFGRRRCTIYFLE
ncbi:MAG: G5 domain-containing protein [Eubacteriales bacterium]|nr:G5 domain-containing protein [Eubacteriales bacterium]